MAITGRLFNLDRLINGQPVVRPTLSRITVLEHLVTDNANHDCYCSIPNFYNQGHRMLKTFRTTEWMVPVRAEIVVIRYVENE